MFAASHGNSQKLGLEVWKRTLGAAWDTAAATGP